jgi:hypothetical protein
MKVIQIPSRKAWFMRPRGVIKRGWKNERFKERNLD